ncbi:hypothetical protein KP509_22G045700 [Ceratopteris richardii]|uniref:Uncharacterized protein n=1 Tax=Ceratopteris richardii TaxID=49495 RepID=A0A8T2S7E6_CERRI|nr:hypothetical protein KP509_22G045700 [Ceratopteris richardii]
MLLLLMADKASCAFFNSDTEREKARERERNLHLFRTLATAPPWPTYYLKERKRATETLSATKIASPAPLIFVVESRILFIVSLSYAACKKNACARDAEGGPALEEHRQGIVKEEAIFYPLVCFQKRR